MVCKSTKYYRDNPEARKVKNAYNKKYHSTKSRRKYRARLVQERRKRGIYGKGGKDVSHKSDGSTVLENPSTNRARNGAGRRRRLKS